MLPDVSDSMAISNPIALDCSTLDLDDLARIRCPFIGKDGLSDRPER